VICSKRLVSQHHHEIAWLRSVIKVIASLKGLPTVLQLQRAAGMTSLSKPDLVAACILVSNRAFSDAAFKEAFKGKDMAKFTSQKSVADVLKPRSGKEAKETKETKSEAFGSGFSAPQQPEGNDSKSDSAGKKKSTDGSKQKMDVTTDEGTEEEEEDDAEAADSGSGGNKEEKKSPATPPRRASERLQGAKSVYNSTSSSQKNPPSRGKKRKAPEKAAASAASEKKAAAGSAERQ
jgi:hypothetical protein